MQRRSAWLKWLQVEWWWLSYLTVFTLAFLVFLWLQSNPTLADPDSFYHAKMAILIRDQGVIRDFPWLDLTVLGENYTDQHFLYHVVLIPFVTIFPPMVGLKLATVSFGAALATVVYWVMRQFNVRWAFFYVMVLLLIRPFTFRISLAKAPSTSLIFLLIGMAWIFHYHLKRLLVLAFMYVWYYGGFPLLGVVAGTYTGISAFYNRFVHRADSHRFVQKILSLVSRRSRTHRRYYPNLAILLTVAAGLSLGVVIHPYFPSNIDFYYHQLIHIGVINFQNVIGVGAEWYPYAVTDLIANGAYASLLVLIGLLAMLVRFRQQSKRTITLFVLTAFFFLLTLKSRRYVEYYIPFAVLFSAFAISDAVGRTSLRALWDEFRRLLLRSKVAQAMAIIIAAYLVLGFGYVAGRDMRNELRELSGGYKLDQFARVSSWLERNTPPGSRIVHSDWDEFPVLFYHNHHNTYISGLDPTFLYMADPKLHETYVDITVGRFQGDLYTTMTGTFGSRYALMDSGHTQMEALFRLNPDFRRVYHDDEASVYEALQRPAANQSNL